jgi:hypothetical protein
MLDAVCDTVSGVEELASDDDEDEVRLAVKPAIAALAAPPVTKRLDDAVDASAPAKRFDAPRCDDRHTYPDPSARDFGGGRSNCRGYGAGAAWYDGDAAAAGGCDEDDAAGAGGWDDGASRPRF